VLLSPLKPEMPFVMDVVYTKDSIFEKDRLRTIDNTVLFIYLFKNDPNRDYFLIDVRLDIEEEEAKKRLGNQRRGV
jgi:hypothetical protein